MALTLVSFGSPRLLDESGVVIAFPEKGLLAAGYIATRPGRSVTRAELAAFLWGEDASNPLVNLRQLLSRVKIRQQEIGTTLLELRENDVLAPAGGVDCDFLRLKDLPANRPLDIVEMSLAHVTGAFFAGVGTSSERAELWLAEQQEHVLSRFAQALEALAREPDQLSREHMQRQAAYRLLEFDPYSEIAYRILINAFTAEGNFAQARAMFDRYSARLQKDLNAQPDGGMLAIRDHAARQAIERLPAVPVAERPTTAPFSPRTGLPRLMLMPPPLGNIKGTGLLATSLLEDVTIGLCRARSVQLVAPHTARRVAAMDEAARQEAYRNCDVSYVLETRFTPGAEVDALFASLVSVPEDATIWAERLPVDPASLGASYNTLVRRLAAVALSQIERHEFSRIGRATTPTAYQNFLIGKHYIRNMELPDIRRARKAFRETLKEMPDFSPALGGLSRTAHLEWLVTARGDTELLKLSEKYAQAAINADDDGSDGFHQLGVSRLYRGAFDESIELFEIAERIAPSHADLIADHADTLVHASRLEDALAKINLAFELNPFAPDYYWWTKAGANYSLHRYEAAIDDLTHVADQTNVLRFNAACWAMLGDMRKARAYMRRTMENFPDFETDKWLALIPIRDPAQQAHYREGLRRAGFK
ncbi:BTAD domain-containing putative transcriptional regulator [Rhizobium sp. LjRoot254]|uniref:BTAD domain-containing putative transcriptional regulator n=1 Tax=Rhizobium sp. LjRoot254 TaxID=3342297 RepID=UPI003ECFD9F1